MNPINTQMDVSTSLWNLPKQMDLDVTHEHTKVMCCDVLSMLWSFSENPIILKRNYSGSPQDPNKALL